MRNTDFQIVIFTHTLKPINMILAKLFLSKSPGANKQTITTCWEIFQELSKHRITQKHIILSTCKVCVKGGISK